MVDPVKSVLTDTRRRQVIITMTYRQVAQLSVLLVSCAQRSKSPAEKRACQRWLLELDKSIENILDDSSPEQLRHDVESPGFFEQEL